MLAYLTSIFHAKHPPAEVGVRTAKEMRLLATAIDSLIKGELPQVADMLMQRFKALELSVADKSWAVAHALEVEGPTQGLATMEETQLAARQVLLKQRLEEAKQTAAAKAGTH